MSEHTFTTSAAEGRIYPLQQWVPIVNRHIGETVTLWRHSFDAEAPSATEIFVLDTIAQYATTTGKRFRAGLLLETAILLDGEIDALFYQAAVSFEFVQVHLTIHDDLIDNSPTRRSGPTVFSSIATTLPSIAEGATILAGDLALDLVLMPILQLDPRSDRIHLKLLRTILDAIRRANLGQIFDYHRDLRKHIGAIGFERLAELKSSSYTTTGPVEAAMTLCNSVDDDVIQALRIYARHLGIAYQLVDDVIGLYGDERVVGKPVGSDFQEGKWTLLMENAFRNGSEAERQILLLTGTEESRSVETLENVREIVMSTGALTDVRNQIDRSIQQALLGLGLGRFGARATTLAELAEWSKGRVS